MKTDYLLHREAEIVLCALTPVNRLVCKVCLHTGLRVGDVLSLLKTQIKTVTSVTEKKTGKRRRIGLTADLVEEILNQSGPHWAFPGRVPGNHQTRQAVWKDIKRAARAFRMPQNVAPHSLRKTYAVELLGRYSDVKRVQKALNHSDQATTMIYAMADKLLEQKMKRRNKKATKP